MELYKNALETTLREELDLISARRQELDEQGTSCVAKMLIEDRENRVLVVTLLTEFVDRLVKGSQQQNEYSEDDIDEENGAVFARDENSATTTTH